MTIVTLCIRPWQAVCKKKDLAHQIQHFISVTRNLSVRMGKGAMDCKWQTAGAVMTGRLKYSTEDIAVLASVRWKWRGEQLAGNGSLIWTERELLPTIWSAAKAEMWLVSWKSQSHYFGVICCSPCFWFHSHVLFPQKKTVPLQTAKPMKV